MEKIIRIFMHIYAIVFILRYLILCQDFLFKWKDSIYIYIYIYHRSHGRSPIHQVIWGKNKIEFYVILFSFIGRRVYLARNSVSVWSWTVTRKNPGRRRHDPCQRLQFISLNRPRRPLCESKEQQHTEKYVTWFGRRGLLYPVISRLCLREFEK
jgi:hypothetical protein